MPMMIYTAGRLIAQGLSESINKGTLETEKESIKEIIREGEQSGVDEIEISVSKELGLSFGSSLEGVPIKTRIGTESKTTIKVKYK